MRTTIDLPEDLHRRAKAIAYERNWTLSQAVSWLMRRGLGAVQTSAEIRIDKLTGFPLIDYGHPITDEDVKRFLEEDE